MSCAKDLTNLYHLVWLLFLPLDRKQYLFNGCINHDSRVNITVKIRAMKIIVFLIEFCPLLIWKCTQNNLGIHNLYTYDIPPSLTTTPSPSKFPKDTSPQLTSKQLIRHTWLLLNLWSSTQFLNHYAMHLDDCLPHNEVLLSSTKEVVCKFNNLRDNGKWLNTNMVLHIASIFEFIKEIWEIMIFQTLNHFMISEIYKYII